MKKLALLILLLVGCVSLHAQTASKPASKKLTLTGKVVSSAGEPVIGATIVVEGSKPMIATAAGVDGSYSITLPSGSVSLTVSSIGYNSRTVPVNNRTRLDITLETEDRQIDDVVVVGYQVQKKVTLTGSVSAISGKDIVKRDAPNLSSALQGLMPGVSVVQGSGRPGADGGQITIRGIGSINSSTSPLILIDGVEGDINQVDMNSVESISALKDASAAIYGSRASNGVILVTTKRGKSETPQFTYTGYYAITAPTEMPTPVSGAEYMEYMNIAALNSGQSIRFDPAYIAEYKRYGADNWTTFDTDWKKEMLKKSSYMHRHALSISGKGNICSYYIDGSYQFQDGLIENNNFSRKTFRVNTDMNLAKWATLSVDFSAFGTSETVPSISTPEKLIGEALTYTPTLAGINRDGTWGEGLNGYNPIAILKVGGTQRNDVTGFNPKANLTVKLPYNLEFKTLFSYRYQHDNQKIVTKPYDTYTQGMLKYTYPDTTPDGKVSMYWKKISRSSSTPASPIRILSGRTTISVRWPACSSKRFFRRAFRVRARDSSSPGTTRWASGRKPRPVRRRGTSGRCSRITACSTTTTRRNTSSSSPGVSTVRRASCRTTAGASSPEVRWLTVSRRSRSGSRWRSMSPR